MTSLIGMVRSWKRLGLILAYSACALALGCSSNSGSQSVGPAVEYLYVGNSMGILPTSTTAGDAILGYSVDNSGNIAVLPGFPIALQFPPGEIVPDPRSRFLLVNGGFFGVARFVIGTINSDHTLSFQSDPGVGARPLIDPLGRFVFGNGGNSISAFAITSNPPLSFAKIPNSPFGIGFMPEIVDPNGNFLIALSTNELPMGGFTIATFRVNSDGSLTQTNGLTFPFIPIMTLDPSGKFLYIEYQDAGSDYHLLTMQVDSFGNLTQTNSDPIFAGPGLNFQTFSVAFIPKSDNFLFAYLAPTGNTLELAAFPIDATTGAVNPSAVFTMPVPVARAFTLDISGQRVFDTVGSGNPNQSGEILTFTIDPKTGQLAMTGQPTQAPCCLSGLAAIQ